MTATYLDTIVDAHRARAAQDRRAWRSRLGEVAYSGPSFYDALVREANHVAVIAEIKRRSPSKGWLNDDLDVTARARDYESGGAAAISVLTDEDFFSGSVEDLRSVRAAVGLPLLRKDFTVSANDVIDAAHMGAAAVLLIVAALSDAELEEFLMVASACHVDALVEVHDAHEAERALAAGARIVGVNQRDLRTFEVDPLRAAAVLASRPSGVATVAESGLGSVEDVARVAEAGVDAVLVGETFVRAASPESL
ncbi:MAG TPA: indole-3-glycerol-phosphate synthase, partial [Acidimicrobiales bacterium]|nr:indole-3-glycerol-phosphate synthase [Acidimicrobiales bacterium]